MEALDTTNLKITHPLSHGQTGNKTHLLLTRGWPDESRVERKMRQTHAKAQTTKQICQSAIPYYLWSRKAYSQSILNCGEEWYTASHMKANGLKASKQSTECCHLSSILPAATHRLSLCKTDICPGAFFLFVCCCFFNPFFLYFSFFLFIIYFISFILFVSLPSHLVSCCRFWRYLLLLETRARSAQWRWPLKSVMSGYGFPAFCISQRGWSVTSTQ